MLYAYKEMYKKEEQPFCLAGMLKSHLSLKQITQNPCYIKEKDRKIFPGLSGNN